ncbi:hypothetical protein M2338_002944 [Sphingobium sp. B2D3B]|uniref:phage terminase small subunit n=1 Tax=Sphingobium sp. B2D3B TaxID=2940580 RepID=UPI0022246567|nr:phage terminase small subunit [Sphingobium sp. B2D3B]MCW2383379.1 hypothetical protein [Sphingobium sp. B2D3B]
MSLARRHRDRILAAQTVASAPNVGAATPAAVPLPAAGDTRASGSPADRAAAQIAMRLTHDLRRLHEIKSVDLKVAAKREMLPEYSDWVKGLLNADAGVGTGVSAEVLPTVMVWLIDVGAFDDALELVPFVLRHNVQMPARYNRDAATIVVEEIAEAALKAHNAGAHFDLGVLLRVAELTDAIDMHDQARAKLRKATGAQQLYIAEDMEANAEGRAMLEAALVSLKAAQALNDRIGVKDKIKRAEKLLKAQDAAAAVTTTQPNNQGGSAA